MWQSLISICIIAIALFFVGKKAYKNIRQAADPKQDVSCGCGCSGCDVSGCNTKR